MTFGTSAYQFVTKWQSIQDRTQPVKKKLPADTRTHEHTNPQVGSTGPRIVMDNVMYSCICILLVSITCKKKMRISLHLFYHLQYGISVIFNALWYCTMPFASSIATISCWERHAIFGQTNRGRQIGGWAGEETNKLPPNDPTEKHNHHFAHDLLSPRSSERLKLF